MRGSFMAGRRSSSPTRKLARGFNAEQSRPPVNDPNLRSQGGAARS